MTEAVVGRHPALCVRGRGQSSGAACALLATTRGGPAAAAVRVATGITIITGHATVVAAAGAAAATTTTTGTSIHTGMLGATALVVVVGAVGHLTWSLLAASRVYGCARTIVRCHL